VTTNWDQAFWATLHGLMPPTEFEALLFSDPDSEAVFGVRDYATLLWLDYTRFFDERHPEGTPYHAFHEIAMRRYPRHCLCSGHGPVWYMTGSPDEAEEIATLVRISPDVSIRRCRVCGDFWYGCLDWEDISGRFYRVTPEAYEAARLHGRPPETVSGDDPLEREAPMLPLSLHAEGAATLREWRMRHAQENAQAGWAEVHTRLDDVSADPEQPYFQP